MAAREVIAVKFIIRDIIATTDSIARLMAYQYSWEPAMERLRNICKPLQILQPESKEAYFGLLILMLRLGSNTATIYFPSLQIRRHK